MGATMGPGARARQILVEAGAVLTGDHFVYVTGDHGDGWIAKDVIFPRTDITSELCHMLAEAVGHIGIDYVCGPATGGLIVSQWTGHHLGVPSLFAQHDDDVARADAAGGALRPPFVLARGYDQLVCGARVLVVDDVINTGHSIRQTADAVADAGGEVVAAAALCTRGNTTAEDLRCSEFVYLTEILIPSWPAAECRLCTEGVRINTRCAHGQDFGLPGRRSVERRTDIVWLGLRVPARARTVSRCAGLRRRSRRGTCAAPDPRGSRSPTRSRAAR